MRALKYLFLMQPKRANICETVSAIVVNGREGESSRMMMIGRYEPRWQSAPLAQWFLAAALRPIDCTAIDDALGVLRARLEQRTRFK